MNFVKSKIGMSVERSEFKDKCTPQERWKTHLGIVKDKPDYVSIVIQKSHSSKLKISKPYLLYLSPYARFGVEKACTIHQLKTNISKMLNLSEKESVVLTCGNKIPMQSELLKTLERFQEPDGFIYFYLC
jgi:hypothetical protein